MVQRIIYTLIVLFLFFLLPVWVGMTLIAIGCIFFKNYFEALGIVFLYEIVFTPSSHHFLLWWVLILVCGIGFIEWIRPYVRK